MVGRLQPPVVGDVLPQRLLSIDVLPVDGVAVVLLRHTLGPLAERLHRRVLPPRS